VRKIIPFSANPPIANVADDLFITAFALCFLPHKERDSFMTRNKKRGKLVTNQSEVKYIGSSYYLLGNDHYQFRLVGSQLIFLYLIFSM